MYLEEAGGLVTGICEMVLGPMRGYQFVSRITSSSDSLPVNRTALGKPFRGFGAGMMWSKAAGASQAENDCLSNVGGETG